MHAFLKKNKGFFSPMSPEQLPGVKKKSFILPYNGGEIWFEHLDGMYQYTELVREKLKKDSEQFLQPSKTSFMENDEYVNMAYDMAYYHHEKFAGGGC